MTEKSCASCGRSNLPKANYCEQCGSPFEEDRDLTEDLLGGRYILERCIGEGGMGRVYLAHARDDREQKYAVKMLHEAMLSQREAVRRFWREASLMEKLTHPNLMPILERVEEDEVYAIVMPYYSQGTLREWLETARTSASVEEVLSLFHGVLDALVELHREGVVHRDLKPSNIMLGNRGEAILGDLGVASLTDSNTRLTRTSQQIGTVIYMAPEQHRGKPASKATDVYAVGLILFEMLTGAFPFDVDEASSGYDIAEAHIRNTPAFSKLAGKSLEAFSPPLTRALEKEPSARFADAQEFQTALHEALIAQNEPDNEEVAQERDEQSSKMDGAASSPLSYMFAGLVPVVLIVVGFSFCNKGPHQPATPQVLESTVSPGQAIEGMPSSGKKRLSLLDVPEDVASPPEDAEKTPSGLATKVLEVGTGREHPDSSSSILVHYTGWTTDGKRFDSSIVRGEPARLKLEHLIEGWQEGALLMVEGETRRMWIPENLAYDGASGFPQGMLVFDIRLIEILP